MDDLNTQTTAGPESAQAPAGEPTGPSRIEASARRHGRARAWLIGVAVTVLVAALGVGAFLFVQQTNRVRGAQARLDAAAALLDSAEDDLVVVDTAVQAEISSEIATQAADALALAASVGSDARAAIAILDEVAQDLGDEMLPVAAALKDSATTRVEMMDAAPVILEADRKAALAIAPADAALAEIKAAEELITKAVAEFNKHTAEAVRQSTANSEAARVRLESARSLLATATAAFPEADYATFTSYIDAKVALIADSKEIDSLWLAGKIAESNAKLDAYNKKDAEIVKMAAALPTSVRDPIADAYEKLTAEARDRYFEARERARAAGDRVRELRGTSSDDE